MSFDEWLVALHVLSAFAYVAAIVLFWVLVFAVRRTDTPAGTIAMAPVAKVGNACVAIGATGTIVLGIWLAFSYGGYDIWDPWIIAALVLWVLAAETGRRSGVEFMAGMTKAEELEAAGQAGPSAELLAVNRTPRGFAMHTLSSVLVLLILVDMIWKPGA